MTAKSIASTSTFASSDIMLQQQHVLEGTISMPKDMLSRTCALYIWAMAVSRTMPTHRFCTIVQELHEHILHICASLDFGSSHFFRLHSVHS